MLDKNEFIPNNVIYIGDEDEAINTHDGENWNFSGPVEGLY